jgi:hypothetical protein
MSEKALVILECEEVFENKQLFPSNDPALQPRGLRSLHTWESFYAPAVCRTGLILFMASMGRAGACPKG